MAKMLGMIFTAKIQQIPMVIAKISFIGEVLEPK